MQLGKWSAGAGLLLALMLAGEPVTAQDVDPESDPEAWEEYEELAKSAGAGEEIPMPGDEAWGKPWKKMCAANDDWCPSIAEGVSAGQKWCTSKKCVTNHVGQSYKIWHEWYGWIEWMCGGQPGMVAAQTMRTEAYVGGKKGAKKNPVFSMTKSGTKECGLASVDRDHAKKLNVNACDPLANVYATCWYRNNRVIVLRDKYPDVEKAPIEDQWLLAGAGGAVGMGKVIELLKRSGSLKTDAAGKLKHASPYDHLIKFIRGTHARWQKAQKVNKLKKTMGLDGALTKMGLSQKQWKYLKSYVNLYKKHGDWATIFGYRPGRTAFRITRPGRVSEMLGPVYGGNVPWGEPVLPDRPKNILEYPGDKLHCACGNWPELANKRPTAFQKKQATQAKGFVMPLSPDDLECEQKPKKYVCSAPEGVSAPEVLPGG
jgi:hypothetical protein